MSRKTIYLAGGMGKFGKENFDEGNRWRKNIKNRLCGFFSCVNPNDYFNFYNDPPEYISEREVMNYDLYRVKNSDIIVVNFNDIYSLGTMAELSLSYELKKPIFGLCEDKESFAKLHPWQVCMCDRIFDNREELCLYLCKFYGDM